MLGGDRALIERIVREDDYKNSILASQTWNAIENRDPESSKRIARAIRETANAVVALQIVDAATSLDQAVLENDFPAASDSFALLSAAVSRLEVVSSVSVADDGQTHESDGSVASSIELPGSASRSARWL